MEEEIAREELQQIAEAIQHHEEQGAKDFSNLIGANFSDSKTGRWAFPNQRSPRYPLGTKWRNDAQRNVTCG